MAADEQGGTSAGRLGTASKLQGVNAGAAQTWFTAGAIVFMVAGGGHARAHLVRDRKRVAFDRLLVRLLAVATKAVAVEGRLRP